MSVKYSLDELKEKGLEIARFNKECKVLATSDGQFFLESNAAEFHASKNGLKVHILEYPENTITTDSEAKPASKSVEERIEAIRNTGDLAVIENLLKGERSKQVQEAATARIEEIKIALQADPRQ